MTCLTMWCAYCVKHPTRLFEPKKGQKMEMTYDLQEMMDKAFEFKTEKKLKEEALRKRNKELATLLEEQEDCLKLRAVVQEVAEKTQQKIEFQISNLVSMALASIFPDPYEFKARFVQRRNRTECDLVFIKDGYETTNILTPGAGGGGVADVASLALKLAVWCIKKTRNLFWLDEPGKFVSRDLQGKFSTLLKTISTQLKVQFVMVSHIPEIIKSADRVFNITKEKRFSNIERIDTSEERNE